MSTEIKYHFDKLNNDNYFNWKLRMQLLMQKENSWTAIISDAPEPITPEWTKANTNAVSSIGLNIEDSQFVHIRNHLTSAKSMWNAIMEYHEKSAGSNSVQLIKEICTRKLDEGGNMERHIHWLTDMFQRIDALGEEKLSEKWQIGLLFGQLPCSYDTVVTALQTQKANELNLKIVQAKLIEEYKRKLDRDNQSGGACGNVLKIDSGILECFFCKKKGHIKSECRKFEKWSKKKLQKKKSTEMHKANTIDNSDNNQLFIVTHKENGSSSNWIIDSGATCHISNNKADFVDFISNYNESIRVADNKQYWSIGKGTVNVQFCDHRNKAMSAIIKDVLYVPEISSNILSVKQLARKGINVEFTKNEVFIKRNNQINNIGEAFGNQYRLRQMHKVDMVNSERTLCAHQWHRILGHRDINIIKHLDNQNLVSGMKVRKCNCSDICEFCLKGKMSRTPFPKVSMTSTKAPMDLVHTDICGPMQTASHNGNRYILTFIDDFSRYTKIYLLKHKSECVDKLKEYVALSKTKFSQYPKIIRSDRGTEYTDKRVVGYLKGIGTSIQYTATYSPQQNGVAERKNRSLIEMARCMLANANLDHTFWAEAVMTATFLQNRLPSKSIPKTPYELWCGNMPNLQNLYIFGQKCFVHVPKEKRSKLDSKAVEAIFMGYDLESKAYRCYDRSARKLLISRDVRFDDDPIESIPNEIKSNYANKENDDNHNTETDNKENEPDDQQNNESEADESNNENELNIRRSSRVNKGVPPKRLIEKINKVNLIVSEPKTINDVLNSEHKDEWLQAMNDEMNAHKANGTWEIVKLPADRKTVGCRWVFKLKSNADGSVARYKARLVAQGFSQLFGVDYDEVFAPVARQTTFRLLLTIASREKLLVHHLDAKTAFLNGELKEEIYMNQPPGFEVENRNLVCRLRKSLYTD